MEEKKKKINWKKAGLYFFYGVITVFLLGLILSFGDISAIFSELGKADLKYIFIAVGLLLAYAALYPLTTCILAKARGLKIGFGKTYVIGMTEHFFNGITPFATGGQPFQIYAFNKAKIKPAESTGLLLMNFIIFMIVTNGYAACSLFYYGRFVNGNVAMNVLAIVGFTMNFLVLAFMISIATSKRIRSLFEHIILWLAKRKRIGKLVEPRVPALCEYFQNMQDAFKALMHKKGAAISCLLLKIVTMGLYYAITFFILRALHVNVSYAEMFFIVCGTSFAITMVVFLPTPGSSGGIEFAFKEVFASIAGGAAVAVAYSGMLVWRLMSYYLMMIISLGFYIGLEAHFMRRDKKEQLACAADEEGQEAPTEEAPEREEKTEEESDP